MRFLRDTSLGAKVLIPPVIFILALGLVSLVAIYGLNTQLTALREVNDIALEKITLVDEFIALSERVQSDVFRIAVLRFMELPDAEVQPIHARLEQGLSDLNVVYGRILTEWSLDQTERAILERMEGPLDAFRQQALQAATVVSDTPSIGVLLVRSSAVPFGEFRAALGEFLEYQRVKIVRTEVESNQETETVRAAILGVSFLIALVGTLAMVLISTRLISRPIHSMTELMRRLADGELLLEVGGLDRRDEIGAMAQAVEVFRNNALQKTRAEKALRESEARLHSIFCAAPTGIGLVANRVLLDVNDRICEMIGRSRDALVGQSARVLYPTDEDYEFVGREKYAQIQERGTGTVETRWQSQDGQIINVLLSSTPIDPADPSTGVTFTALDITERVQMEKALRESEEKYRQLFELESDAIFMIDNETGQILEANAAASTLYGYSREELLRKKNADLSAEPQETRRVTETTPVIAGQVVSIPSRWHRKRDGTVFPVEITGRFFVRRGRSVHIAAIRDITERKQAEESLRASEANYRAIFNAANDAIFVHDLETGDILDVNQRMCELYGYTPEEVRHINVEMLSAGESPYSQDDALEWITQAAEEGPQLFEWRAKDKAGRLFWVEVNLKRTVIGGQDRLLAIVRDITSRKQAEEALQESQRALSTLMSNLPGMAYRCQNDDRWTMEFISDGCLELTGYHPDDLVGNSKLPYVEVVHPDDREAVWDGVQAALAENRSFQLIYRIQSVTGEEKWVWEQGSGVLTPDGTVLFLEGFITDITERRRAEMALQEYSDRLEEMVEERAYELKEAQERLVRQERLAVLGQLAGGVGHELRNPLGAINNAAYLLNMVLEDPEPEVEEALRILEKEVKTSEKIIRSLLDFARVNPPIQRQVDVNDVVRDVLARVVVPQRVEVVHQFDEALPAISADPDQLGQVFGNIIRNAVQAMPEGGRLTVRSHVSNSDGVIVSFSDTGAGIAEGNLSKVFEPLFTTKARGIGLGLALVKTLVEGHGGTVEVESELDKGSVFMISLPLCAEGGG